MPGYNEIRKIGNYQFMVVVSLSRHEGGNSQWVGRGHCPVDFACGTVSSEVKMSRHPDAEDDAVEQVRIHLAEVHNRTFAPE